MFSTSGIPADYSGSTLRFGLVDIKPVQVVETIKRFGLKLRTTTRSFQSLKPSQSFEDFVTFANEATFSKIDIPGRFQVDELVRLFSQRRVAVYESDTELKQVFENLRKSARIGRPLLAFTRFIMNRFESNRENYSRTEARRFLNSDFPLSFYNKFVVYDNTFYDFLRVLKRIVGTYESRASVARSFPMYSRQISEMKRILGPIIDQMDSCHFHKSCLKKYVIIWNSNSYDEIAEEPEFLDSSRTDPSALKQLNYEFEMRLEETRRLLLEFDGHILQKELDPGTEPTRKMFAELTMLPSSSLGPGI